jgi:bifunctional DNA-binding transcriptional regulator/antitoxin component of YhaV-PrlF toxin-antitoxin module
MIKVIASINQYKLTLPKNLAERKEWENDTKLRFIESSEGIVLLKRFNHE